MRVVIKPLGLTLILGAIAALVIVIMMLPSNHTETGGTGKIKALTQPDRLTLNILDGLNPGWTLAKQSPESADISTFIATDGRASGLQAMRVTVKKADANHASNVAVSRNLVFPYKPGEKYVLRFLARSPDTKKMTAVCEQTHEPFAKDFTQEITLTQSWKQYEAPFVMKQEHSADARIAFQVGANAGTYEITTTELVRQP